MSLDASDVSALADTLTKWEYAEYFFAGLVTLACLGEFVAEFTDWFTKGIEERKKRLGKRSTLVLVGALAFELICLVKTNSLSGKLIVSINEQSQGAVDKSKKALEDSNIAIARSGVAIGTATVAASTSDRANHIASNAVNLSRGARQEADSFEKDIIASKEQLALMSARYKLIRKGEAEFLKAIDLFPGQKIELQACRALETDIETNALSQSILELLTKARWDIHSAVWQSCLNGMGVNVYANEASTPSVIVAANSLGRVLDKLLRIDRKPGEFNTWAKLRDDKKFSPWNWYHPYLQESSRLPQTLYDSRYSDGFHSRRETRQTKT
jgi:hypothetical protein